MVEISFQSPRKLSIFHFCPYFFHFSLSKIWQAHPHNSFVFEINKDRSIISQSLECCILKLWSQEVFEIWSFFTTFLEEIAKKYLVVEWLSWLPYKSGFINSNIFETSKDRPNTPPSLKLLEQTVHELVRGSTEPPPPIP